ncbi:Serine/threonine-protein kinase [Colletotrichum sp. SAR11_59]|uniref:cyclin-dependent kinase n=1 Tax=Colletotrichum asianum TaxID=702518 RepID=A0A8H3ZTS4_9PEZI|nr:cyclin-dependent kinase g-1 [Colletotrichum asianum]KAI8298885.1 Serine/threonine-protein kinase [Colletotrichum sp. SAR11_59]
MASNARSRWADSAEDAALEAKLKREKEEKKRIKAEKARKAEADRLAQQVKTSNDNAAENHDESRPTKRRKFTPDPEGRALDGTSNKKEGALKPMRMPFGHWRKCRSVENYEKLNDIEEGTYGWVSRAKESRTNRVVALKRLKIEPGDRNGLPVTGLREIQILRDCNHRNIVNLEEVVVGEETTKIENIFLVLEFVEHDLKSILEDMPEPFLLSEVKTLLRQLTAGVAYLHDNWILHRDLKTSNLLLNNRGQLKIADFGMARYVGDPPTKLTQLVVTLWYRSPELLLGAKTYGKGVDMWSVGCIFGELLTREPLLQGSNEVDQVTKIFEVCGVPTQDNWPTFRSLPNARSLRLPKNSLTTGSVIRAKFTTLTNAGCALLNGLLSLNPDSRPSAKEMLDHMYFREDPKPKKEGMFPTFPSKAGQERRRRHEPNAPERGQNAVELGDVDFSGIFQGRDKEERGGGFSLRMV